MRKIFLATVACIVSVVSATKNSVLAYSNSADPIKIFDENNIGSAYFEYSADFGYVFNTAITYPDETQISLGSTFGFYSGIDLVLKTNILGFNLFDLKVTIAPLSVTPFSGSVAFTHPLAMASKGAQM